MITLLDPPEDDEVLYSVLYAAPNPSSLPLQNMVAPTAEHALDMAAQDAVFQSTRLPSGNNGDYHAQMLEEISTDDETDDEDYTGSSEQDDSDTVDSLRRELMAIEDSWGKHGLEHMLHVDDEERVDGIPTFTMPVKLDMSWDESDFLEEMAEDMKLLDDVAGKVLHEEEVDDDGIEAYISHLEMIETSLKHELMSIEYIWKKNGVDLTADKTSGARCFAESTDDSGDSLLLKSALYLDVDEMATFTESDDESSRRDDEHLLVASTGLVGQDMSEVIVPIQEMDSLSFTECDADETSHWQDNLYRHEDTIQLQHSLSQLRGDHEQATTEFVKITSDLSQTVASLQIELETTRNDLATLREQLSHYSSDQTQQQKSGLRRLRYRVLALMQGSLLVGAVTFASLVVISTVQRRPLGCMRV